MPKPIPTGTWHKKDGKAPKSAAIPTGLSHKLAPLTDEQIKLGSMFLAIQNLGMGEYLKGAKSIEDLRRAYGKADMDCAEGTGNLEGPGAEVERKVWARDLRRSSDRDKLAAELRKRAPYIFAPV